MQRTLLATSVTAIVLGAGVCGTAPLRDVAPARPVARAVTVDDLMAVRTLSTPSLSPDGTHVAYVTSQPSLDKNEHDATLFVIDASGSKPVSINGATRVFNRPVPRPQLRWSPDSSTIAFLGFISGQAQVVTVPAQGGNPRAVTSAPEGVAGFEWSPDSRSLAYVAIEPMSPEEKRRRAEKSFVIQVDRQDRPLRLWIQPLNGSPSRVLTPPDQFVERMTWSPDSRQIVYAASHVSGFMSIYDTRLYMVASSGGMPPHPLVDRPGMNMTPQFAPDGRSVAFVTTNGGREVRDTRRLALVAVIGDGAIGAPRLLTARSDQWFSEFAWAPDGKAVYTEPEEGTSGTQAAMFERPLLRVSMDEGSIEPVDTGQRVHFSPSVSRDGTRIAFRAVGPTDTGDVFVMDLPHGRARRITEVNPQLRDLNLAHPQPIKWRSFDGAEIWGLLLEPPAPHAASRVPLLVYCHGGPIGGVTYGVFPQFAHLVGQVEPYPVQAFTSAGFAVLIPMPRGGSGYGARGHDAIVNSWGETDYQDIMTGVDDLVRHGIADPDRLGVMGASYGGFLTSWIVGHTGRFKAASTDASTNDLTSLYYVSEGGDFMVEYFKTPWENARSYTEHSPLTYADRVTTPLLIQHGESDQRVPLDQARAFYRALKVRSKATVEFDIYPRAGHVVYEPALEREQMQRNFDWFVKWLKP